MHLTLPFLPALETWIVRRSPFASLWTRLFGRETRWRVRVHPVEYTVSEPPEKLVASLRRAADLLAGGQFQYCGDCSIHNACGLVARVLLELDAGEARQTFHWRSWSAMLRDVDVSHPSWVLRQLAIHGLDASELRRLEKLANPDVVAIAGIEMEGSWWRSPDNAVRYLRAWAELLEWS
jgi:hypothetical protein